MSDSKYVVSPISRLASEVLSLIFGTLQFRAGYVDDFDRSAGIRYLQLATIARVSRLWNTVVSPILWRSLNFNCPKRLDNCLKLISRHGATHDYGSFVRHLKLCELDVLP